MSRTERDSLARSLLRGLDALEDAGRNLTDPLHINEIGTVESVGNGVALVSGLPGAAVDEVLQFEGGIRGVATELREELIGVTLLQGSAALRAGDRVTRTGRVLSVPVGDAVLGRVLDPLGVPLDGQGPITGTAYLPIERPATPIFERGPVTRPLQTGIKVIDSLFPIGRGQRELIVGDRQTGKSSIALATILAQHGSGVRCVYCGIGMRGAESARLIDTLRSYGALEYTTVVLAASNETPGLRQIAPFAATSIAEAFMEAGHDSLIVYDDLTRHARSYREVSLLLNRPPGREAYPGDIFYLHSRLLERATQLSAVRGGKSLTALPIIETQERNLSAYVPTNLISITDGQIVLSPELMARGIMPAVDIGLSVSRVGGKAQLPALRAVAGRLRLAYAQYEELERFARFGADVDEATRNTLRRGRRVRASFAQAARETVRVGLQVAIMLAVAEGVLDALPEDRVGAALDVLAELSARRHAELLREIEAGAELTDDAREALLATARAAVTQLEPAA